MQFRHLLIANLAFSLLFITHFELAIPFLFCGFSAFLMVFYAAKLRNHEISHPLWFTFYAAVPPMIDFAILNGEVQDLTASTVTTILAILYLCLFFSRSGVKPVKKEKLL